MNRGPGRLRRRLALSVGRTTGRAITSSSSGRVVAFGHSKNTDWVLHWSVVVTPGRLRGPILATPAVCIEDLHADPRSVTTTRSHGQTLTNALNSVAGKLHSVHWLELSFSRMELTPYSQVGNICRVLGPARSDSSFDTTSMQGTPPESRWDSFLTVAFFRGINQRATCFRFCT